MEVNPASTTDDPSQQPGTTNLPSTSMSTSGGTRKPNLPHFTCYICLDRQFGCPERLCWHMEVVHLLKINIITDTFPTKEDYKAWLKSVNTYRPDQESLAKMAVPLASMSEPKTPTFFNEKEYYYLCQNKVKSEELMQFNIDPAQLGANGYVEGLCTAFIHVVENKDGTVTVQYCLDHYGYGTAQPQETLTSTTLTSSGASKRRSEAARPVDSSVSDEPGVGDSAEIYRCFLQLYKPSISETRLHKAPRTRLSKNRKVETFKKIDRGLDSMKSIVAAMMEDVVQERTIGDVEKKLKRAITATDNVRELLSQMKYDLKLAKELQNRLAPFQRSRSPSPMMRSAC